MRPRRDTAIPAGLAVFAFLLALVQRPGRSSADTKIDLHVDPMGFLAEVASVWSPTGDLGHVQGGQYGGYLFPMGPFFSLGHGLGLAPWLVQRLWLGLLLALAAWGTVLLADALLSRKRGVAHLVAGAAMIVNPYVVVFANRTSITLLAYAALPWLLLAVHRGLREPRGWWWPAAFALIVTSTGGGINVAVTAWILVGPLLLLVYEPIVTGVPWRAARGFALRAGALSLVVSLWWMAPLLAQAAYGIDFLAFIEQPGTIWGTTSASEILRLMGYWTSYAGASFSGRPLPLFDDSKTLLFATPVVVCSLIPPALALAGFVWTRRWRYGPFFMIQALAGLVIVGAGFPEGTPLRRALTFVYNHVDVVQFLRTSHKAAPLVALSLAMLLGVAAAEAWRRLVVRAPRGRAPLLAGGLGAALAVVVAVGSWPLTTGRAVELTFEGVPASWRQAAKGLDRELPANRRAWVLPGPRFAFYRWGGTVDPILPVLTDRPVAVRAIVPYADLHATDVLWTIDGLVGQQRLYPGQLRALLDLTATGAVIAATDDDRRRSGTAAPADVAGQLDPALGPAQHAYGPDRPFANARALAPPADLPEVRRHDVSSRRGIIRVEPQAPLTVVDGSADALAGLAAFGALGRSGVIRYAGDLELAELRDAAARGAEIVISDSNRRRIYVNARTDQNLGATLAPGDPISEDAAVLNPFAGRGSDAQTVAVIGGARYVRAPSSPGFSQFPEHRAFAAFDGDVRTSWLADTALAVPRRWVEIGLRGRRNVPELDVVPAIDERGITGEVEVGGRRFGLRPGVNRLKVGLRDVDRIRVRITRVRFPPDVDGGAGGLREVRIPGVRVTERLRVPREAERSLAGRDLDRSALSYLFARTTGDDPLHRATVHGPAQAGLVADREDGDRGVRRQFSPPAARTWLPDAWLAISPEAPDSALDRLAGYDGPVAITSSGRYQNRGAHRGSSAFSGDPARPWIAPYVPGHPAWLAWRLPAPVTVTRLRLGAPPGRIPRPPLVRLRYPGAVTRPLRVGRDGTVALPAPLRAMSFRLDVLAAGVPAGTTAGESDRRAVGIARVEGAGVPRLVIPRAGALRAGCGSVRFRAGPRSVALRPEGAVPAMDRGEAIRGVSCGPFALPGGRTRLDVPGDAMFR
ncbi:MAG: alpha-(1-_3)-arabinofuranosyltransferase domain-containing protein, partial [Solirubrobacteraceae bacterium]